MYLLRVTVEQISRHWPIFKYAIEQAAPPTERITPGVMNRLLEHLMVGKMQAWVAYKKKGFPPEMCGILVTNMVQDELTGTRGLFLFSVYVWDPMTASDWEDGFKTIQQYAKHEGCTKIAFYTNNPRIIDLARKTGFYAEQVFGVLHLGEYEN